LIAQEDVSSLNTEGDVLWPLTDQVGTIRDIAKINSSNEFEIVNHRVYDSFGNLTSETNSSVDLDYGFTGRFTDDATGLTFHINRWLDPRTGKWLSDDPISFAAGDTNLQRYVSNEVLAYYDVDGLLAEPVLSINGDLSSGQGSDDDERAWWYPGNWPSILAESIFGDEEERREMMFGNRLEDENRLADDIALQKNKISNPTKFMRDGKRGTPLAEESIKQGAELAINHLAGGGLMAAPGGGAIAGGTKTGIKKGTNRTIDKIDVHVGMSKPSQKHLLDLPKPAPVISTISKANSPVWKELNPFRGKTKTNGLTGSKRRFYEWDHTHSDIEIYNGKGVHLGSIDPTTGKTIKPAVPGRTIDL
jgi:RHS repeat-associated protein